MNARKRVLIITEGRTARLQVPLLVGRPRQQHHAATEASCKSANFPSNFSLPCVRKRRYQASVWLARTVLQLEASINTKPRTSRHLAPLSRQARRKNVLRTLPLSPRHSSRGSLAISSTLKNKPDAPLLKLFQYRFQLGLYPLQAGFQVIQSLDQVRLSILFR